MANTLELQIIVDDKGKIKINQFAADTKQAFNQVETSTRKTVDATEQLKTRHERLIAGAPRLRSALIAIGAALTAITAAATAAIYGLQRLLNSVSKVGDQIAKMSIRTGMSTEMLSALSLSARLADASIEELAIGLRMMQNNATMATMGVGESKRAFAILGISVRTASGGLKTADELFFEIADKLGRMKDATARTSLAMDIFGRSGTQLIPLLEEIAERKKEVIEQAKKLGIIFKEDAAEAAVKFRDSLTVLNAAIDGIKFTIGNVLIPAVTPFVKQMTETAMAVRQWADSNKDLIQQNVELWLITFKNAAERLLPVLRELYKFTSVLAYLVGLVPTQLENRIEQLRRVYRAGTLSREDLRQMLEATRSRIEELQRGLSNVPLPGPGMTAAQRAFILRNITEEMNRFENRIPGYIEGIG